MAAGKLSPLRGTGPLLRTTTFVAAAITAILLGTAASVAQGDENYEDPLLDIVSLSFSFYSLVWCAIALLVLFFQGSYHPGIDVGFDLVGWAVNWEWSAIVFISAPWLGHDNSFCNGYWGNEHASKQAHVLAGLTYTSGVLMVLYGSTHLALFVMACKATHERKMRKKRGYAIELDDVAPLKNNAAPQ